MTRRAWIISAALGALATLSLKAPPTLAFPQGQMSIESILTTPPRATPAPVARTDKAESRKKGATASLPIRLSARHVRQIRKDLECLALNIYHEARSEPKLGQIAVAAVTLNRVADPEFPDSVCEVVLQGGPRPKHRCQFSWWCDGKSDKPRDRTAWREAKSLAFQFLMNRHDDPTDGALFYHADYVNPRWASQMRTAAVIGRHIFYIP